MSEPNDRELEQYLKGGSPVSRRYREASGEGTPPALDEAVLAKARAEVRRKPRPARWLSGLALAASVVLGVNLGWNVYKAEPVPTDALLSKQAERADDAFVPEPPAAAPPAAPAPEQKLEARRKSPSPAIGGGAGMAPTDEAQQRNELAEAQQKQAMEDRAEKAARQDMEAAADADRRAMMRAAEAPAALAAPQPPMTEREKIDRLINYIGQLDDVDFIRNGKEYSAADAAKHMRLKLDKAGDRCDTADEFIRVCASFSSMSGEAYLIRFPDGRTRTAEDVLREQLATMP